MKPYTQATLVADSLSLGPHWVYNPSKLARLYPEGIHTFTDPISQYHSERKAGQLTHYGDQLRLLEQSIQDHKGFSTDQWRSDWLKGMQNYDGYLDGASKETLENQGHAPSSSNDLAGASRIAPILDLGLSLDEAVIAARAQTHLTHGDLGVADAAEFFIRAVYALQAGSSMSVALELAADAPYSALPAKEWVSKAQTADPLEPGKVSGELGLTCHLPEAFPLTLYFACRPEATFESAISENGLAGGDTSARAMLLAVLFAARDGDVGASLAGQLDAAKPD